MHQHMLYNYHRQTAVQCERFERRFLIDQAAYNARMNAAGQLGHFHPYSSSLPLISALAVIL